MSRKVQMLRAFVNERLTVAVEEIFVVFERTITEYEHEVFRSKAESEHKQRQLDAIIRSENQLNRTDTLQVLVSGVDEFTPVKQEPIPCLGKGDPEPPLIKEEQDELPLGPEENDVLTVTLLSGEIEADDDDGEPLSSDLSRNQNEENGKTVPLASTSRSTCTSTPLIKIESNGDNNRISELDKNLDSVCNAGPFVVSSDCCETGNVGENNLEVTMDCESDSDSLTLDPNNMPNFLVQNEFMALGLCNDLKSPTPTPASYSCKVCEQCFQDRMALMLHVKTHPRECGLCGKHLEPRETLKRHFQTHKRCRFCSKRFSSISLCERHMAIHTGELPFNCTECGKGFSCVSALQRHTQSHTKPFSCEICGKRFGQQTSMKTHMRVHTGEKPYKCKVCGKRFTESGSLTKHVRVHTGERPFACKMCKRRFAESGALKTHMKSHTETCFCCKGCEQTFDDKKTLRKHMETCKYSIMSPI